MSKIMVHGLTMYGCQDCGKRFVMYLEKGIADDKADKRRWKPVPYGIACPFCKGIHAFDNTGLIPYSDKQYHELPEGVSYFANVAGKKYGIPAMVENVRDLIEDIDSICGR